MKICIFCLFDICSVKLDCKSFKEKRISGSNVQIFIPIVTY